MIANIKYISGLLVITLIFLLAFYCSVLTNRLQQVNSEKSLVAAAMHQAQADLAETRAQYLHIQEAINNVATQKQKWEKRTAALQRTLLQSQRQTPCGSVTVPDAVSQRLRERAEEVNAAATLTGNAVSTLPSS